jgi:hypothetical protein
MKAQRRHELQQNKLALWVVQFIQRVRPHVNKIVIGVVGVVAAIVIVSLWRGYVARGESIAWDDFVETLNRGSVADLEKLAEENPGSTPGNWAALVAANVRLRQGCEMLFDNKQNAADELRKAVVHYTTVIESSRTGQEELQGQAYVGRARAYEALAGAQPGNLADLAKAIADYEKVVGRWSSKPYAASAGRQLAALQSDEGRNFYTKFAAYTPKRPASREPGAVPSLDELLKKYPLDEGQFPKQPSSPEDQKGKAKTPEKPGATTPPPGKGEPPKPEAGKASPSKPEPPKPEPGKPEVGKPDPAKKT